MSTIMTTPNPLPWLCAICGWEGTIGAEAHTKVVHAGVAVDVIRQMDTLVIVAIAAARTEPAMTTDPLRAAMEDLRGEVDSIGRFSRDPRGWFLRYHDVTAVLGLAHYWPPSVNDGGRVAICPDCSETWPCQYAALAADAARPPEGCTCEPEHVWPCALIPRCDEPGCERETTCGWPSPNGYRRTCGEHYGYTRLTEDRP